MTATGARVDAHRRRSSSIRPSPAFRWDWPSVACSPPSWGRSRAAPFAVVLLGALLTRVGPLETFPILIALVTAFLSTEGAKYFLASHEQRAPTGTLGSGALNSRRHQ